MRLMQLHVARQRIVCCDELSNGCFVVGEAKLSKQVAHIVDGAFHVGHLLFSAGKGFAYAR